MGRPVNPARPDSMHFVLCCVFVYVSIVPQTLTGAEHLDVYPGKLKPRIYPIIFSSVVNSSAITIGLHLMFMIIFQFIDTNEDDLQNKLG